VTAVGERAAPTTPNASPKWWSLIGRRWEAADFVVAAAAGLVVVIFAVFIGLCIQAFGTTVNTSKTRAMAASETIAQEMDWLSGSVLAALDLVDAKLSLLPTTLEPTDKADLDAALAKLAIYDPQGLVVPNGGSANLPADISSTEAFAALSGGSKWLILPQSTDAITGTGTIVFARALGTDAFAGVALISLSSDVLASFIAPLNLGQDSTLTVVRSDGWLVARSPHLPEAINVAEASPYWNEVKSNEAGSYVATSPRDGITRIVGYRHLPKPGLIVYATISQDALYRNLWTSIWIVSGLLVPIALALLGGSLWTAHLLRRSAQTQRTLQAALAHNEVLFREIHHRVKNNLQSVASLLQMQPIPREIKTNMGQRIAAMSAVHEHIYRSSSFDTVRVKDYLQTLVETIGAGHDPNVRVFEDVADLPVDREAATPLGLIVNEVVSNAFKHAFADGREGVLTVQLIQTADGRGQLTVEDNGMGFDPQAPTKGIGRRLIAALTQQIGGESKFETAIGGGSLFTLTFPLASPGTPPSASPLP
jgi:two-component sensor histidine kinase